VAPSTLRPDARALVALVAVVFVTGLPLALWFDGDAERHAASLPAVGLAVRALHAAASSVLVVGVAVHLALRVAGRAASWRGVRTGALAYLAVAVAAVTGAMAAQTGASESILGQVGLAGAPAVWLVIVHVAYASLVVLVTLYLHVARWGRRLLDATQATWAVLAAGALAMALGGTAPGSSGAWAGSTWIAVPPVPVLWLWTAALAVATWALSRRAAVRA